jgi:hypothetical protein
MIGSPLAPTGLTLPAPFGSAVEMPPIEDLRNPRRTFTGLLLSRGERELRRAHSHGWPLSLPRRGPCAGAALRGGRRRRPPPVSTRE